jgi:glycosyltransferase involved in cell wall biosynthesis
VVAVALAAGAALSAMRILHVVPTYLPAVRYGGPIHSVHGLCRALARAGHEVSVMTTSVDGDGDSPVPPATPVELDGITVRYYPSRLLRRLYFSRPMARALPGAVRGADIVHLHSVFLWPTLAAARAARAARVPYVLSPRGMLVRELIERRSTLVKRAWIALFERGNLERAAAVHCTSDLERNELQALGLALRATFAVPNGVDLPEGLPPAAPGDTILYLGRINWKKGIDRLIESLRELPQASLVIAGNDEEGLTPRLRALAESAGVAARVKFPGYVEGATKRELLRTAGVFVLPSVSENFGNAALEAMAHGCPVVLTKDVGLADAVRAAGAGVVSEGDPASLARAIRSLTEDLARRAAAGAAALALAKGYGWDRIAAEMAGHYERLRHA